MIGTCILLIAALSPSAAPSSTPAPLEIPAAMVTTVDSASAHTGDRFTFKTTQTVKDGELTIPAQTPGTGIVTAVSPAAGAHRGELSLEPQFLTLANGKRIDVVAAPQGYAARRHVFPFPIPLPIGVLAGGVVTSGNVRIGPGTTFEITPAAPRAAH